MSLRGPTIKRHLVVIPEHAERESGFFAWLARVWNIGLNTGASLVFYTTEQTAVFLKKWQDENPVDMEMRILKGNSLLEVINDIRPDDNLILVMSRKSYASYQDYMGRVSAFLNKYFAEKSFILVYPVQLGVTDNFPTSLLNTSLKEPFVDVYKN